MNANSNQTSATAKAAKTNHRKDSDKVYRIARKHLGENSSARVCMASAMTAQSNGNLDNSMRWALRSIAHSFGILHPDYLVAFNAAVIDGEVRLVCVSVNS